MSSRYDVKWKPFLPYAVNTNSVRQVEFTKRKSSHTGTNSCSGCHVPRECSVDVGCQSTRHTVNSSQPKIVWQVDRRLKHRVVTSWPAPQMPCCHCCDELTACCCRHIQHGLKNYHVKFRRHDCLSGQFIRAFQWPPPTQ